MNDPRVGSGNFIGLLCTIQVNLEEAASILIFCVDSVDFFSISFQLIVKLLFCSFLPRIQNEHR